MWDISIVQSDRLSSIPVQKYPWKTARDMKNAGDKLESGMFARVADEASEHVSPFN